MLIMRSGRQCVGFFFVFETKLYCVFFFPASLLRWSFNAPSCLGSPSADVLPHNHPSWSSGSPGGSPAS